MVKLHDLSGQIIGKESRKVYSKSSPYHGNNCYKLTTINDQKQQNFVFVYPNLVRAEFFDILAQSHYIDKRYLFFCEKKPKRWVLHRWEELPNNPEQKEKPASHD